MELFHLIYYISTIHALFGCCLRRLRFDVFVQPQYMLLQALAAYARLGAVWALVGLLARVLQNVRFEISILGKGFRAIGTLEGSLACMSAYMSLQIVVRCKRLRAVWTVECPFTRMATYVLLQIVVGGKRLWTMRAN